MRPLFVRYVRDHPTVFFPKEVTVLEGLPGLRFISVRITSMYPNIRVLRETLCELAVAYAEIPGFEDALIVKGKPFVRAATPFNTESIASFCRDKDAVYKLLLGKVKMPRTRSFLDPSGSHGELASARSLDEILIKTSDFVYPRMVKMNQGERGMHVYKVENDAETKDALSRIFDKSFGRYDYIALIQEYIRIAREIRVIVVDRKPEFAYERSTFRPLNVSSVPELLHMAETAATALDLHWGSVDFIESAQGETYFIEANTKPGFEGVISAQGDAPLKKLYSLALKKFIL